MSKNDSKSCDVGDVNVVNKEDVRQFLRIRHRPNAVCTQKSHAFVCKHGDLEVQSLLLLTKHFPPFSHGNFCTCTKSSGLKLSGVQTSSVMPFT